MVQLTHVECGQHYYATAPWIMQGLGRPSVRVSPCFGEHSQEVFAEELGLSAADYEQLEVKGITGNPGYSLANVEPHNRHCVTMSSVSPSTRIHGALFAIASNVLGSARSPEMARILVTRPLVCRSFMALAATGSFM